MSPPRAPKVAAPLQPVPGAVADEIAGQFIGQWVRLVSTTNWEKGRIICAWREALIGEGAPHSDYSDETWAQLVGGVTSQHIGRLRRVAQRFGENHLQYPGLYWSHFQAAIEWDDAEMWLEGAIQNEWSVSQMRGQRWEAYGAPGEAMPADDPAEDPDEFVDERAEDDESTIETAASATSTSSAKDRSVRDDDAEASDELDDESIGGGPNAISEGADTRASEGPDRSRQRLSVDVDDLPADVAEAFECFKLAIITHRRLDWTQTTPQAIQECLDALRQLTLADA